MNPTEALKILNRFGTEEELVEELTLLKIQGKRMIAHCCPVSNYMQRLGASRFAICQDYFILNDEELCDRHDVPATVAKFISHFDQGHYTELVEPLPKVYLDLQLSAYI